jgi:NAD(P)-dependent dehydrogenase (short-subunit alcohol dehydrogenase family)
MKVLLVGATGLIGKGVAAALAARHEVVPASRSSQVSVDLNDPASIADMFRTVGRVDAIASCAGHVPFNTIEALTRADFVAGFTDKALGQIELAQQGLGYLNDGGSITLMTGVLARTPIKTGAVAAAVNGAVESYVTAAAIELPRGIRINAISPTVLEEATGYHPYFPGFPQVTLKQVTDAYIRAIDGWDNGVIYRLDQ